jgi:hypothetical protein
MLLRWYLAGLVLAVWCALAYQITVGHGPW